MKRTGVQSCVAVTLADPYVRHSGYAVVRPSEMLIQCSRPLTFNPAMSVQTYNDAPGPLFQGPLKDLELQVFMAFNLHTYEDSKFLPVLFDEVDGKATAITPDLVNGASYGGVLIAPEPFLREHPQAGGPAEEDANANFRLDVGEDQNDDQMLNTYRDPFKVWSDMEMPASASIVYIDDWFLYHLREGEVHCSSNELREIPTSAEWWE